MSHSMRGVTYLALTIALVGAAHQAQAQVTGQAAGQTEQLFGRITAIDASGKRLMVQELEAGRATPLPAREFVLEPGTSISDQGSQQPLQANDLRPGAEVRIEYTKTDLGQEVAQSVVVESTP